MKFKIILALSVLFVGNICLGQIKLVKPMHATKHGKEISSECLECHKCGAGQYPSRGNLCIRECTRPASTSTSKNDIVIIDRLVDKYEPVIFAHDLHANMSAMSGGCENCHHYSESEDEITCNNK